MSQLTINSDIAQSGSTVILDIRIRRIEQGYQYWDSAGANKLLSVFIYTVSLSAVLGSPVSLRQLT